MNREHVYQRRMLHPECKGARNNPDSLYNSLVAGFSIQAPAPEKQVRANLARQNLSRVGARWVQVSPRKG